MQGRNRDTDAENKYKGECKRDELKRILLFPLGMDTKGGKWRGEGGGGMNWEIGIDIYTLICIK